MTAPKITRRKISEFKPDPANPNQHTERGVGMLEDSLAKVGLGRSIVVDKNGIVLAGNSTQERAIDQGFEDAIEVESDGSKLIVVKRTDLDLLSDEPRARLLSYYDNRSAELGIAWSGDQLLADLNAGVDLSHLFSDAELDELLAEVRGGEAQGDPGAQLNRAEELVKKYSVERGQCWILGRHRIMCGSSYDSTMIAQLMNGSTPDMLHTDPPYGINIVKPSNGNSAADSGGAKPFGASASATRTGKTAVAFRNSGKVGGGRGDEASRPARVEHVHVQHGKPSKNQWAKNHPEYLVMHGDQNFGQTTNNQHVAGLSSAKARNEIIQSNIYPVIEGDDTPFDPIPFIDFAPVVILWGANYYADKLPIKACWIAWDKREDITRNNFADCELAWTNQNSPARLFHHLWNGLHKGSQNGERRIHPTEKPVALFEEIGKMFCPDGLWVDLFAGSGAQIVAAEQIGTTCYAMEYEPLYVACILERLSGMGLEPRLEGQ